MWSEREKKLIQEYCEEIRSGYRSESKVPLLATLRREPNPHAPNFLKIGKKFEIPKEFFEPGHRIIVRPFADFVALSEYQFLIDMLKNVSTHHIQSDNLPNMEMVDEAVRAICEFTRPDYIIVPIAFYMDFHQWSRVSGKIPCINYDNRQAYYRYGGIHLRVLWSNKFIRLNEIIIGNSRDGEWLFKSANGDERLTVRFYFEQQHANPILLVQTVFRFRPPAPQEIYVIEFSEDLLQPLSE